LRICKTGWLPTMIGNSDANLDMQKRELEFLRVALDRHAIVSIADIKGKITYVNDKFCEISGYNREELLGQNHRILKSGEHPEEMYAEMWRTIAGGDAWHGEIKNLNKDGDYYWVSASIIPFLNEQGKPFQYVSIRTEITKLKEEEEKNTKQRRFIELLHRISEMVSEAPTVEHSLQACLDEICNYAGWPVGHAYLYHRNDEYVLRSSLVFHLSDPAAFEVFKEVTVKTKFRSGEGLPGRVYQSRKPAWIIDVTKDSNFPRAKLAKNIGIKAGFAFPVTVGDSTFAVLEFFAKEAVEPDKITLDIVANICRQLGGVIARKEAELELAAKETLLRLTFDTMTDGIFVLDSDLNYVLFNEQYKNIVNLPEGSIKIGGSIKNAMRAHAERGDHGPGDIDQLVSQRLELLASQETNQYDMTADNGNRVMELRKASFPDGGAVVIITDITDRKKAEEIITQQKAVLETTLETMDQGITMIDSDLNVISVNSKFKELLEFPEEIFGEKTSLETFFRYNAERGEYGDGDIEEQVQQRIDLSRKFEAHHFERTRPDGLIIEIHGNPLPDNQGMVTTYTDITERKQAEEKIAAKEAQLRMAMENMPGAMLVVDSDLRVVTVNEAYREYYGDPDGLVAVGASVRDIVKSEIARGMLSGDGTPEEILVARIESYQSESIVSFEDQSTDGRYFLLTRTPAPGGHTITVAVDITERKQTEDALAEQKAMLELVLDAMDQGLTMFDGEHRLSMFNSKAPAMLNTPDQIVKLGVHFEDWYRHTARLIVAKTGGEVDEAAVEERVAQQIAAIRDGKSAVFERPTIDDRTIEVRRNPVGGGGFVSTFTDITERKTTERIIANAMALINESIQYASRIQRSVLPDPKVLEDVFAEHAVIWEPKDVVGGDVYLYRKCDKGHLLALIDCTGHGVPGAFMTMIVTGALDQAIIEFPAGDPAALLKRVNQLVKVVLGQDTDEGESDDGFECGLCLIDNVTGEITYAGARFELWCVKGKELAVVKGDKVGIGYRRTAPAYSFNKHIVPMEKGVRYYMTSDGLIDQVGGAKRRAFGKRRLKGIILDHSRMKMATQAAHILRAFEEYQHDEERRDDISLIGFKPKL